MANTAPQQHNSRWSSSEIRTLKQMVMEGKNSSQIAIALGRTRASVMGKKASMDWGSKLRILRGSNGRTAPMTAGTKTRKSHTSDHNVYGEQSKIEFEKTIEDTKKQLKADKIKTVAKIAKDLAAKKKAAKKNTTSKKSSDIGVLVSQLKSFAKQSGLKVKITFEN
jgi:hypothetical protein